MTTDRLPTDLICLFDVMPGGTRALGPGLRYAIWAQGCPFSCPGCVTPESRPVDGGRIAEVASLADDIIRRKAIDGITISGGEPFMQAAPLGELLRRVRERRPELTVVIFTGFRIEQLKADADSRRVLGLADLVVDGPYVDALNDGIGLRGSSNQRLHFLTDRLLPYREELERGRRKVEVEFNGAVTDITGIPLRDSRRQPAVDTSTKAKPTVKT